MKYRHICIGGTFDHLHAGHAAFLHFTLEQGEKISIGLVKSCIQPDKKFAQTLQSYVTREKNLHDYFKKVKATKRTQIFPLQDAFGIGPTDETLDAIVVTKETKGNAIKINQMRKKNNLSPLKILLFDMIKGPDEKVIRSTRIRKGIIDRNGAAYLSLFLSKKKLILPKNLRNTLRQPLGQIIEGPEKEISKAGKLLSNYIKEYPNSLVITVGDIVTKTLIDLDISPDIAIIDHMTQRDKNIVHSHVKKNKHQLSNPPATIQRKVVIEIYDLIQKFLNKKIPNNFILDIEGEEDLLALPAILLSPLGSMVIYGQRDLGVVIVQVTKEMKEKVTSLIVKFD